jgi:hypothetical protein
MMNIKTRLALVLLVVFGNFASFAAIMTVPCDNPSLGFSPYVWKSTGAGAGARAEATFPGAYAKSIVKGTSTISLVM